MSPTGSSVKVVERHGAIILFLLALLFLLPGSGSLPLIDRDEPRFSRATVEMMERSEWVVPYFNSDPAMSDAERIAAMRDGRGAMDVGFRFDKPVLTYWLMRAGYAIFGLNETGARFHSVLSAALLVVVIFFMGRRWLNARAGFLAGLAMLTCVQTAIHGRSAVADMPMALFVCTAMFAMWELLQNFSWRWFALFHLSLGLGFLAKGPVALIVPLLTALLWRFAFNRQPAPWRNLKLHLGLPLALALMGAWGIPALLRTEGMFWKTGIGEHVVERGMKAFNGRYPFPLFYVLTMFVSLFPWSIFMRDAWRVARGKLETERRPLDSYLLAWFLAPLLVFSFYSTQLMHYILPGFPAFFLLLARAWSVRGTPRSFRLLAIGTPVAFLILLLTAGPYLRSQTPAVGLRDFIAKLPPQTKCAYHRFREPSLVYYSGRPFTPLNKLTNVVDYLAQPGPRLLITQVGSQRIFDPKNKSIEDNFADFAALQTNGCDVISFDGINVAQGRRVSIRAIYKP